MRLVLHIGHAAVADFQHVRIVPVSWPGVGLQTYLLIENGQHPVGAASAVGPFFLTAPAVVDIAGRTPKVSPDFFAPEPRFGGAPLADAQYDWTTGSVECGADVGVGGLPIL